MLKRNDKARLRKVQTNLDKAMDALHRANGELYPAHLADYRQLVDQSIQTLENLQTDIGDALSGVAEGE
jgi:hypothetical protein